MNTYIKTNDYRLSWAQTYVSRTGRSVAVILHSARHPRYGHAICRPQRVYLSFEEAQHAKKLDHLVNLAMHQSRKWLDDVAARLWHAEVVAACVPLREKCKPLLIAIAKVARNNYGAEYWTTQGGRDFLSSELRLIGVTVPPFGPVRHFLTKVTT